MIDWLQAMASASWHAVPETRPLLATPACTAAPHYMTSSLLSQPNLASHQNHSSRGSSCTACQFSAGTTRHSWQRSHCTQRSALGTWKAGRTQLEGWALPQHIASREIPCAQVGLPNEQGQEQDMHALL